MKSNQEDSVDVVQQTLENKTADAAKKTAGLDLIQTAPNLSEYLDFRKYLQDFYNYRRTLSQRDLRPYNYAMFSAAADIKSPNYLKMIIEGRRNLSEDMVGKFSKAMGHSKEQSEEFRLLVIFGQSSDPAQRNYLLKELSEFRVQQKIRSGEIDKKNWDKVPNWIAWVLYAMADQAGVKFEAENLRRLLRSKASVDEITTAMSILLGNGDLVQDAATGEVKKGRGSIESSEEVPVALVRKLQSELMYLGMESLYQDSPADREFGSLTLTLTRQEFEELRFKLRQIRKQAHKDNAIERMTAPGERVYQLNVQLFPVTDKTE